MNRPWICPRSLAALLTLTLVAAACGSSGDTTTTDAGPPDVIEPASRDRAPVDPAAPDDAVAAAINQVGWSLLATEPALAGDENTVFSPASIGHAVLMARAAGDDATVAAIDTALGFPAGIGAHEGWNAIDAALIEASAAEEDLTVTVADRIWPRIGVEPDPEWIDVLAAYHGVDVQPLDFAGDEPGSRDTINGWVDERTGGLIPELIPSGFIQPSTVLVLTDALYLEARWATPFGKYGTETRPFTRLDGTTVDVELMRELELGSERGSGDGYVGAELPYVGDELSMLVIVPDEGRFDEVRGRLGPELLAEVEASFTTGPFELLLPRWTDDTQQLDLVPWLTSIGASPGAYPAISPDAELAAAVHGADIAVDEWGTVAAAATAFGFEESGPPEPELTVAADRPFLYLIRHRDTGLVLFLGQVTDPTVES